MTFAAGIEYPKTDYTDVSWRVYLERHAHQSPKEQRWAKDCCLSLGR